MSVEVCAAAAAPLASFAFSASMNRRATSPVLLSRWSMAISAFCRATIPATSSVTTSAATTTAAVTMKSLGVRPRPRRLRVSVPLTRGSRPVVLAVLVLVGDLVIAAGVHRDLDAGQAARRHGDRLREFGRALVPHLQGVGTRRHVVDREAAVEPGLGVPRVVAHDD